MQTPLRLSFRHMSSSTALESRVRAHVNRLERMHAGITGCEVVIAAPAGNHRKGAPFDVRINVSIPDGTLHVHDEAPANAACVDVYVAVRAAFDALARKLEKHADARRRSRAHASIRKNVAPVQDAETR